NGGKIRSTAEAATAKNDLTAAYNDAAGRANAPVILGSTINGTTLAPGLYRTSAAAVVGPNDLILDASSASNPATAVFVFQIHDALTTAQSNKVVLTGGALAKNVYWQVGSSATLGASSQMKGNILALTAITIGKNASLQGRAMARNASVTLDTNAISAP
ncbi:MAG: hypothetical protein JWM80_1870, partial [Cyanobacteria bacterium RYN_339]|nr:hypothetical protein [Cyanobacteria bacterium RYN_339]